MLLKQLEGRASFSLCMQGRCPLNCWTLFKRNKN